MPFTFCTFSKTRHWLCKLLAFYDRRHFIKCQSMFLSDVISILAAQRTYQNTFWLDYKGRKILFDDWKINPTIVKYTGQTGYLLQWIMDRICKRIMNIQKDFKKLSEKLEKGKGSQRLEFEITAILLNWKINLAFVSSLKWSCHSEQSRLVKMTAFTEGEINDVTWPCSPVGWLRIHTRRTMFFETTT